MLQLISKLLLVSTLSASYKFKFSGTKIQVFKYCTSNTLDRDVKIGNFQIISSDGDGKSTNINSASSDQNTILLTDIASGWGNGKHPTTKLCLEFVLNQVQKGDIFLDYGCGSGILSILAGKLGASKCIGVEVDHDSIRASRQNGLLNSIDDIFEVVHTREVYVGMTRFPLADITVANILPVLRTHFLSK